MKPLSGNSSDTKDFGEVVRTHIDQLHTSYGTTYLVADSALYSADNLQQLAKTRMKWITRVPGTLSEAQEVCTHANPARMTPMEEGYRFQAETSTYGGVAQRWVLIYSEQRRRQAQRTVDKQWCKQSDQEIHAFKKLCRRPFACEADAQQALADFGHGLAATMLHSSTIRPVVRYRQRGRPGQDAQPEHVVYHIEGALASPLTIREARLTQHSCFILATNELDAQQLPPQELLDGYKGQSYAERGFRFLKDPTFLASSLYLKKPERIMALLMVMTICLLVYAALEYRIRKALTDHDATFPNQKGKPFRTPQRDGSSNILWVFTCYVCLAKAPWSSISMTSIKSSYVSSANRICGFMASNVHKKSIIMQIRFLHAAEAADRQGGEGCYV